MVLVDTNIIIDYWKAPDDKMTDFFEKEDIAICGVVEAELIHGAPSEKEIGKILNAISCFEKLPFSGDWVRLGRMLNKLRKSGITVPFTDAIIAQTAIEYDVNLLTNDHHFALINSVIPELHLYATEKYNLE